jgi:hypothetical protein
MKIRLKSEEKLADTGQFFESMAIIVGNALGGDTSEQTEFPKADPATAPRTFEELEARMTAALG